MIKQTKPRKSSAFAAKGFKQTIRDIIDHTKMVYLSDDIPWVVGYSGGKDSTAILQLVWQAIKELKEEGKDTKPVHVITTDTLVENPAVSLWVDRSLSRMRQAVKEQGLNIEPHKLVPEVKDRFWVNLVGRGYPAPRFKFRWCTDRLKIAPSNNFINTMVKQNGEAILVLGTRAAEGSARASNAKTHFEGIKTRKDEYGNEVIVWKKENTRQDLGLSVVQGMDRVWSYTPINEWTNDDVWSFLSQVPNHWNHPNTDLLGMYQGATEGGECPLVVDDSTPSCGDSRFGCYVCTMVGEDKSFAAMIQNDEEKEWMLPLMGLKELIDVNAPDRESRIQKLQNEKKFRDFRRMNGSLTVFVSKARDHAELVYGPYKQHYREQLLEAILRAQVAVNKMGPEEVRDLKLLDVEDLEEIRRLWVEEKHEREDSVPRIYEKVFGKGSYPGTKVRNHTVFNSEVLGELEQLCKSKGDEDGLKYQQIRNLLSIVDSHKHQLRRTKMFNTLRDSLDKGAFASVDDARRFALSRKENELLVRLNDTMLEDKERVELQNQLGKVRNALSPQESAEPPELLDDSEQLAEELK